MHTSLLARIALAVGVLAALAFAGVPLGIRLGWVPTLLGFRIFMLGGLLGVLSLLLGLAALYTTRRVSGRTGRGGAIFATVAGAAIVAVVAVAAGPSASLPPINDITTDLEDPPSFQVLAERGPNAGRDMSHPGEGFASQQREAYPDLAPIELDATPGEAFASTLTAMESFGWEIARRDLQAGEIEATDTSRVFHFVDDIAVRITPTETGSRVDVRSKSRDGLGDLGVNAARIRRLRDALRQETTG